MAKKQYSFTKGLLKGAEAVVLFSIGLVALTQFADVELWVLLETHLKPFLSGVTVVGVLRLALNWIKFKNA